MSWLSQSLLVNCRLSSCCLFVVLLLFRVFLDSFFCLFSFVCLTLTRDKFQSSRFADVKRRRCFCQPSLYALPFTETTTATTKPIYNTHKTYSIYCYYYLLLFVVGVFLLCHKTCFNSWFYLFLFFPALFFCQLLAMLDYGGCYTRFRHKSLLFLRTSNFRRTHATNG